MELDEHNSRRFGNLCSVLSIQLIYIWLSEFIIVHKQPVLFFNSLPYYTIYYPSLSLYATIPIRLQEANSHSVDHVGDIAPQSVVAEAPDATPKDAIPRLATQTHGTNHWFFLFFFSFVWFFLYDDPEKIEFEVLIC